MDRELNFSQRNGLEPVRTEFQVGGMDHALCASLWNTLHFCIFDKPGFISRDIDRPEIFSFSRELWFRYFKQPFSTIPSVPYAILEHLQNYFFGCPWNKAYDFLEAVLLIEREDSELKTYLDYVLDRELAGYKLIENKFVPITDPVEIAVLKGALGGDQFEPVAAHLRRAMELLADRTQPDYRNSIKESISAVECTVRVLLNDSRVTLGDGLKKLEQTRGLHSALSKAYSKIYGFTNDAGGIRHSIMEDDGVTIGIEDAKFFLLSCTSFSNYLKSILG